jgi:hypothetical protein
MQSDAPPRFEQIVSVYADAWWLLAGACFVLGAEGDVRWQWVALFGGALLAALLEHPPCFLD